LLPFLVELNGMEWNGMEWNGMELSAHTPHTLFHFISFHSFLT
jgi:hypothetical protein